MAKRGFYVTIGQARQAEETDKVGRGPTRAAAPCLSRAMTGKSVANARSRALMATLTAASCAKSIGNPEEWIIFDWDRWSKIISWGRHHHHKKIQEPPASYHITRCQLKRARR